jgi:succinate dehydrogenase/fumarate reductase cytochrome b subunit
MTTWLIHRITGLMMIGLFAVKFVTAFYLLPDDKPSWAVFLHRYPAIDISLIFLVSFHSCFGLKNILFDIGLRKEKLLVYGATIVALILSITGTIIYLKMT